MSNLLNNYRTILNVKVCCRNCSLKRHLWTGEYRPRFIAISGSDNDITNSKKSFSTSQSAFFTSKDLCDTQRRTDSLDLIHQYQKTGGLCSSNLWTPVSSSSVTSYYGLEPFHNHGALSSTPVVQKRFLHSTVPLLEINRSTVEKAVNVLKKGLPKDKEKSEEKDVVETKEKEVAPSTEVVKKKSIRQRVWAEVLHYYHGFKLFFVDLRIASRYVRRLLFKGDQLSRRERRQLVRTTADLFRLVPFSVFIIVPFMEFLLPVALRFFPQMLPSTFKEESKEVDKQRKRLKYKLEMAKLLQDTVKDSAVKKKGAKGETVEEFARFMEKVRSSGEITTNEEILKYATLFEDEITLDNLNFRQLRALCKLLEIPVMGVSETVLRWQLELKLRQLEADDRLIKSEGIDSLAIWELQEACRARGMRSLGCTEERLKSQLSQWLDLHLHHKLPTSLLLMSRALYLPQTLDTASQIKATLSELSASAETEARVKISEVTGDRVDSKAKLEIIKQEEALIKAEKDETEKAKELEKAVEEARKVAEKAREESEVLLDKVQTLTDETPKVTVQDTKAEEKPKEEVKKDAEEEEKSDLTPEVLEKVEVLLEKVADKRRKLKVETEDLEELKEDVSEYKEQVEEMQKVVQSVGTDAIEQNKGALRLTEKVNKLISEMDKMVGDLTKQKEELIEGIKSKEDRVKDKESFQESEVSLKNILGEIDQEKKDLISIDELLDAMKTMQQTSDEKMVEKVVKVLDEDEDGVIDISDALKVIELLSQEHMVKEGQAKQIIELLRKEQKMHQERKVRKQQEKERENLEQPEQSAESKVTEGQGQ